MNEFQAIGVLIWITILVILMAENFHWKKYIILSYIALMTKNLITTPDIEPLFLVFTIASIVILGVFIFSNFLVKKYHNPQHEDLVS